MGQGQAEAVEQHFLSFVGGGDAAHAERVLSPVGPAGFQHNIATLDLGEFFNQRSRGVARPETRIHCASVFHKA